jgi:hypothetical protein
MAVWLERGQCLRINAGGEHMPQAASDKPYYFLRHGVGFHFLAPPPGDMRSRKYLYSEDHEEVLCAILAHAQEGNFGPCRRLLDLMQHDDDWHIWYGCSKLLAYTAPQSILHEVLTRFSPDFSKHAHTAKWVAMLVGLSGCLWAVPDMLRLFYLHPPPRTLREITGEWYIPDYLSLLLEPQSAAIAVGPAVVMLPRDPAWPDWVDTETTYDDDGYRQAVMQRYQWLCERVTDPDHSAVCKGEIFTLRRLAHSLSAELSERGHGTYAADEIWLDTLEAYTGLDTTSQSGTAQQALIHVQHLLDYPVLDTYEPGVRYFFGHRIPN